MCTIQGTRCTKDINGFVGDALTHIFDITQFKIITSEEVERVVPIAKRNTNWRFKLCGYYDTPNGCRTGDSCPYVHAEEETHYGKGK